LNYGLLIAELGLLARATVVIGKDRTIAHVQIVPEVATEPDYDAALKAAAAAG
jgi:thiol peroxidase